MLRRLQLAVAGTILAYAVFAFLLYVGLPGVDDDTTTGSGPPQPNSLGTELSRQQRGASSILKDSRGVSLRSIRDEGNTNNSATDGVRPVTRTTRTFRRHDEDNPNLPPLASLIDSQGNVTGDVQFLLDFAIVGFGKAGTSTIMHWLAQHPEVRCFQEEIWELMYGTVPNLVRMLYEENQRCYKCPAEITQARIMDVYRALWPRTKLIVGVRHPVRAFESLYNFRVQNLGLDESPMPNPLKLMGRCGKGMRQTCTDMSNYAYHLIRLGKQHWNGTREPTPLESHIVNRYKRAAYNLTALVPLPNPVFLYAVEELADANATRRANFRVQMQRFLGLSTPLPPILHYTPGRRWTDKVQRDRDAQKIDICQDQYKPLRDELMRLAAQNSAWMSTFITYPSVFVASGPHMLHILEGWTKDACTNETYIPKPRRKSLLLRDPVRAT